jgi:hypothetical protein
MIDSNKTRISTDRVFRFINQKKLSQEDVITAGDYIFMKIGRTKRLCYVYRFRFKTGKVPFKTPFCPIKHDPETGRGVELLVSFWNLDGNFLKSTDEEQIYVDIDNYVSHAKTYFDKNLEQMIMVEEIFPKI